MTGGADRRLRWLLSSNAIGNLGDGIAKVAFPLLAATLTRDPVLIAGLAAVQFLPWLLFALLAGALVDRVDRRRAVIVANVVRAAGVGATALMVQLDAASIWLVYAAALVIGTAETVAESGANVIVPSVVPADRLASANGKLQACEIVGQTFLGGPLGSTVFAVFATFPFLLSSAGYALAAALLLGMAGSYRPPGGGERRALRADLAEGLRWLRGSPVLLRLVAIAALVSLITELAQAQLVLYALDHLHLNEAAFGAFALVGGIGGLIGAAVAARLIRWFSRLGVLTGGIVTGGIGFAGMGVSTGAVLSACLFGLFAAAVVAVNVVLGTARHALVPGELLGRVLGVWRTLVWGAIPVGALAGGLLTDLLGGPSATFLLSGALQGVLAIGAAVMLRGRALAPPAEAATATI